VNHLKCPTTDCNYVWCKMCQKEILPKGRKHSCDGSSEMARLVKRKGWRYCPTCKTPCEKISGCNFISCISPGCHTHFCYGCRALIIRSVAREEIYQKKKVNIIPLTEVVSGVTSDHETSLQRSGGLYDDGHIAYEVEIGPGTWDCISKW